MSAKKPIVLTRLEARVMQAVWDGADPITVRDVAARVNQGLRDKDTLAYTTIQSVLNILRDKGILETLPGPARALLYRARVSREQTSRHMVRDLADRLFGGEVQPLLVHMLDETDLDEKELRRLRAWVDMRLRDREGGSA
ncbi:hypothetical protein PHYC_01617 [Phycisphaerales bacterium]|nr:hypothetical protein PHYC_01617 [Phycisphaerales bacterium]